MYIPLVDLAGSSTKEIDKKIASLLNAGDFVLGKQVEAFEKSFAEYLGKKFCIGVASGTDALFLSLLALGIGKGDEVIVPAATFIATANAVLYAGATPVFVDILSDHPTIDPSQVEDRISRRTKAIIPVHMQGFPADMKRIQHIAKKRRLVVIEDACQAHGSLYFGKKAGTLGTTAAFSFYPSKNLGAFGDAGAIVTSEKRLATKLYSMRHHGQRKKDVHTEIGYNSRLDTIQAAVLSEKLKGLDAMVAARREHAQLYTKLLQGLPIGLPKDIEGTEGNYYLYNIRVKKRDALLTFLRAKGVQCGIHYSRPLHLQPVYKFLKYKKGEFPNAEKYSKENLSLPMYPGLKETEIIYVVEQIKRFFGI